MPTIIPGYVYSLFAALIVGVIVVASCGLITSNIKADAESQQLKNIQEYIASQTLDLISSMHENQITKRFLNIPSYIGNQPFWIQLVNGPNNICVEIGFGNNNRTNTLKKELPVMAMSKGYFISNSGKAFLQCSLTSGNLSVYLGSISIYSETMKENKAASGTLDEIEHKIASLLIYDLRFFENVMSEVNSNFSLNSQSDVIADSRQWKYDTIIDKDWSVWKS